MKEYRISGFWRNEGGEITHYALHTVFNKAASLPMKKSKAEIIALIQAKVNVVKTRIWDYKKANWMVGQEVQIVDGAEGIYLRSNPDYALSNNLKHLINYSGLTPIK